MSLIIPIIGVLLIGISKAGFAAGIGMISTPLIASGVLTMEVFMKALCFAPVIPPGVILGRWANKRIPQKAFNHMVYIILTATALKLLFF